MKKAFTLIELLVVITIIALLAGIAIPVTGSALERARRAEDTSNLRQIGAALMAYAAEHDNLLPTAGATVPYGSTDGTTGLPGWQEQLEDGGYINDRKVFRFPSNRDNGTSIKGNYPGYFLGSRAAYAEAEELAGTGTFGPVNLLRIQTPSSYILGGVSAGYDFGDQDADRDNYTNEAAFGGQAKTDPVVILFGDGHVADVDGFDPLKITTRYTPPGTGNEY